MKFSEDIEQILSERYNLTPEGLQNLSLEELKNLKTNVEDLRHEYFLLEMASKLLGNGLYGCCANQYFYFFNVYLAGDITGECRELTKTMNANLIKWFHEDIWERKDLWERFEFALDESKHDWYREQKVWVYSDTDSSYVTFGNFFKAMTPEYQEKYKTDEAKVNWILKYCKEFQDKLNNKWCEDIYNPRHGKNIHEFELETISAACIYLKKKKYLKGLVFSKGKFMLDHPKVSGTGIEIIKSTTPKLCRTILKDLMNSLMFNYHAEERTQYILAFNSKLADYRKEFYKAPTEDISQSVGVGDYKKYVVCDEGNLELAMRCPPSVHAIARYNWLAKKMHENSKCQYSGKIKYYNIHINEKTSGFFGFPSGELPSWAPPMDKLTQWQKTVIDPINRFLEVMDIPKVNAVGTTQLSFFDL